jgi:hypothetical protein
MRTQIVRRIATSFIVLVAAMAAAVLPAQSAHAASVSNGGIVCTFGATVLRAQSDWSQVIGEVVTLCSAPIDSITVNFSWYPNAGGPPVRLHTSLPCFGKTYCVKTDHLTSGVWLNLYMCIRYVKAGYPSFPSGCLSLYRV